MLLFFLLQSRLSIVSADMSLSFDVRVSVRVNQSSSKRFTCLFRDHAEWLVDVLLPQGKEHFTFSQSVFTVECLVKSNTFGITWKTNHSFRHHMSTEFNGSVFPRYFYLNIKNLTR